MKNENVSFNETLSSPTAAATLNSSIEAEESDDDNSQYSVSSFFRGRRKN